LRRGGGCDKIPVRWPLRGGARWLRCSARLGEVPCVRLCSGRPAGEL
jgi:hypothetical protein